MEYYKVSYTEYKEVYNGKQEEEVFNELIEKAYTEYRYIKRKNRVYGSINSLKKALCEVVDVLHPIEIKMQEIMKYGPIKSESEGTYSITFQNTTDYIEGMKKLQKDEVSNIFEKHLQIERGGYIVR